MLSLCVVKFVTYVFTTACPIKGQIRKSCAPDPSCMAKCNSSDDNGPCLELCVVNGYVCPNGTIIINEKTNECVAPDECPGDHLPFCSTICVMLNFLVLQ